MNNLSYLEFTAQTPITLKAGCAGGLPLVFTRTAYQGSGRKRLQFRQGISSIKSKLGSLATGRSAKSRRSQQVRFLSILPVDGHRPLMKPEG